MEFAYDDLIGVPFVDGGRDPKSGLDCWGLVKEAFRRQGCEVPDYHISAIEAADIAGTMKRQEDDWISLDGPRVGCLVLLLSKLPIRQITSHSTRRCSSTLQKNTRFTSH